MSLREAAHLAGCGLAVTGTLLLAVFWFALLDLRDWRERRRRTRQRGR